MAALADLKWLLRQGNDGKARCICSECPEGPLQRCHCLDTRLPLHPLFPGF
jgi:hypothetical protein